MPPRNPAHAMLQQFQRLPLGLRLFSIAVCLKAPYFSSIRPRFDQLRPGFASATMRKRRKITNHLGTVHAMALANLCEFVSGTLMEISTPANMRWIPKAMDIRYLAKAQTAVTATCQVDHIDWTEADDIWLEVKVHDKNPQLVAEARIPMYVSPKPTASPQAEQLSEQ